LKAVAHSPTAALWGALVALLFFSQASKAQGIQTSIDIGAAALRYADTLSTGTIGITPHVFGDWKNVSLDAAGTFSQFTSGGSSLQGVVSASRFFSLASRLLGELGGLAGGSTHNDGTTTGEGLVNGRLHFGQPSAEFFAGGAVGRACYGGACPRLLLGEIGTSFEGGPASTLLSFSPAMIGDSVKYADLQATLGWSRDRLDATGVIGHRIGDEFSGLSTDTRTWASASLTGWLTRRIALVGSGGTYPIDPTQGFPGGRFVSFAVRISTGSFGTTRSSEAVRSGDSTGATAVAEIVAFAVRAEAGTVSFTATAPGAERVEISGDFTNWVPVAMQENSQQPGQWVLTLPIPRGKYQMNIRRDGGQWTVPAGLLPLTDEFGGSVGLLVIE
jgi:hypothetical protein